MSHQTGIRGNYECKHFDLLLWELTLFSFSSQHFLEMKVRILEVVKRIVHGGK
jgi:hypothetical protein